jgi:hypothetical protein
MLVELVSIARLVVIVAVTFAVLLTIKLRSIKLQVSEMVMLDQKILVGSVSIVKLAVKVKLVFAVLPIIKSKIIVMLKV